MVEKADRNNCTLKPHFKTHQSREVGRWCRNFGINKITVSSTKMAAYFAADGWHDITIAFPVNPREWDCLNQLSKKVTLSLLISDPSIVPKLADGINHDVKLYIEIDTGSDRTGINPEQTDDIQDIISRLSKHEHLQFKGFYSHPGHSYSAGSQQQVLDIQQDAVQKMNTLKTTFGTKYPDLVCCVGDTPCCSVAENWDGIDEMSPGNFVFYDLMQAEIGSCRPEDIAVSLACPVVAKYPSRNEIAVHGGGIHLAKDRLENNGQLLFGKVVTLTNELTWNLPVEACYVKSISQEHGIIACSTSFFESVALGDIIGILPVHSCMTADTMKGYLRCNSRNKIDHMQSSNPMN